MSIYFYLGIGCIFGLALGGLFLISLCTIAAAADRHTEELLRDGHEHY